MQPRKKKESGREAIVGSGWRTSLAAIASMARGLRKSDEI
jgi:hypothetical protein